METKRIIVFDDDKDILEILSIILTENGYQVETLESGESAAQVIKSFNADLILMDVMLGPMDGRLICRQLKQAEDTKFLPLILISASHDLSLSLQQQGAPNDFVAKPFDIEELLQKIDRHLAH